MARAEVADLLQKRDLLLELPANNNEREGAVILDSETRQRFVRALAEMIVESILKSQ